MVQLRFQSLNNCVLFHKLLGLNIHTYMLLLIFLSQVIFSVLLLLWMVMSVKQRKTPITTKEGLKLPEIKKLTTTYTLLISK